MPNGEPTRLINPETYHPIDRNGIDPWEMMLSIPKGMGEVASIIFFIFIVGGSFNMIQATGAVESGIRATVKSLQGKEVALLFVIVVLFSIGGTTFGMAEEALVFIPMLVPLAIALGYDSLTGLALALVGPCAGFTGAFMNPFTLAVAQGIVGLPIFSGMAYRIVIWVLTTLIAFGFIYWYARKVKKNPRNQHHVRRGSETRQDRSGYGSTLHRSPEARLGAHVTDFCAVDLGCDQVRLVHR